ncbi:transposase [Streptomyces sp. NPDC056525]|uniref:transposase n=1 Tax=unclassified Streptomyces TaxID=2593676 RepID=UPI0036C2A251
MSKPAARSTCSQTREASSLAAWLAKRPGVEVICRDRAPFFAEGATAGAPQAIQVADRWHLWHNLSESAERAVARHRHCLRVLVPTAPETGPAPTSDRNPSSSPWPMGHRFAERTRAKHATIHALLAAGHGKRSVARQLGTRTHWPELDALTKHVRSFAAMSTGRQGERLPHWPDAVRQDDLPSLHTLVAGIDRDRDAVIAGLTLPAVSAPDGRRFAGPGFHPTGASWPGRPTHKVSSVLQAAPLHFGMRCATASVEGRPGSSVRSDRSGRRGGIRVRFTRKLQP